MLIECRDCGVEFDPDEPQHSRYGFYNQCRNCGSLTDHAHPVARHVGIAGGEGISKAGNISIIRHATKGQAAMARAWNSGRWYNGIGSTTTVKDEK